MIVPLPCPFCGIEPKVIGKEFIGGLKGNARVECVNDDCVANPIVEKLRDFRFLVREGAVVKWNDALMNTGIKLLAEAKAKKKS